MGPVVFTFPVVSIVLSFALLHACLGKKEENSIGTQKIYYDTLFHLAADEPHDHTKIGDHPAG